MEKCCLQNSYKPLWLLSRIWCCLLTSDRGRRPCLACNQSYLSLWHPGDTSLMRQVVKMFLRKAEREEMCGQAPLLWPGVDRFGTLPCRQCCHLPGLLPCFIYITDVFGLTSPHNLFQVNLELQLKLVIPAKACGSGGTNWGLIWSCHPTVFKAGQWRQANRRLRLDMHSKEFSRLFWNVLVLLI